MHSCIELRKITRYRLRAQALFMWVSLDGKPQSGQGATRDINTLGVYVLTEKLPPIGALVQMEIVLPNLADTGPGMHLKGEGVVLRCESESMKEVKAVRRGFAASAQFFFARAYSAGPLLHTPRE
jgi:hypothetical protein